MFEIWVVQLWEKISSNKVVRFQKQKIESEALYSKLE
jgi:hypothetical protein